MIINMLDLLTTRVIQLNKHKENIIKALEYTHGTYTFDDVCKHCVFGNHYFFENGDSFLIGYQVDYPSAKAFHVFLAGGSIEDLQPLYPIVYAFARDLGCVMGTFTGRRGWKPMMEKAGWKELSTTFVVDIQPEVVEAPIITNQLELPLSVH